MSENNESPTTDAVRRRSDCVPLAGLFELMGRRLYPDGWVGNEIWDVDDAISDDGDNLASRVASLERKNLTNFRLAEKYEAALRQEGDEHARELLGQLVQHHLNLHREASDELAAIGGESAVYAQKRTQRALAVRERMVTALAEGRLGAHTLPDSVIPQRFWSDRTQGSYRIADSIGDFEIPRLSKKRGVIVIDRATIPKFLDELAPRPLATMSPEEYVVLRIKDCVAAGVVPKKPEFFSQISEELADLHGSSSGASLQFENGQFSERRMAVIWGHETPKDWRRSGPKDDAELPAPGFHLA